MYFYYFKDESKIIQIPKISDVFKSQNKIINKNLLLHIFFFCSVRACLRDQFRCFFL